MKNIIKRIPLVKKLHRYVKEKEYKKIFENDCYGCFWGVFETFEEARQMAPETKTIGYDNLELAQYYKQTLEQQPGVASFDYPVLFWLNLLFGIGCTQIFDFGGNVGTHYYAYSKYLTYPKDLKWVICEVPAIIQIGQEIAKIRTVQELDFTTRFEDADNSNVLVASGSIQYVENLAHTLSGLKKKPEHLLINRLPLYDGEQFVTLQNGGKVFYPQYVFNKAEFIGNLENLGYELVDVWEDRVDMCIIPFHPDHSVPVYSGLYLRLTSGTL
jgi:putative methyltransferase (TIGR04325 family)